MFMQTISTKTAPAVFYPRFQRPSHSSPTNFSESNYSLSAHNLKKSKFRITIRGPLLWNNSLTKLKTFRNHVLV